MNKKIKFVAVVFGVTLALCGSIQADASVKTSSSTTVAFARCDPGTTNCTTLASGFKMSGVRVPKDLATE